MLQEDKQEDLGHLFDLCNRVAEGKQTLKAKFQAFIVEQGLALVRARRV